MRRNVSYSFFVYICICRSVTYIHTVWAVIFEGLKFRVFLQNAKIRGYYALKWAWASTAAFDYACACTCMVTKLALVFFAVCRLCNSASNGSDGYLLL